MVRASRSPATVRDVMPAFRYTDSMQIDTIGKQLEIGDALRTHIGNCCAGAQGKRAAIEPESAPDCTYRHPERVN
jgi:hypothetical protein